VFFDNRAQAEQMIKAWAVFNRTEASSEAMTQPTPNPQRTSSSVSADFPKKVRNAIFIMVGLGATIMIVDALRYLNSGQ
tara:strand:+ start:204 stop:440 length:237 start_codon:yes stop_codon:yes gene_type:complete